VLLGSLKTCGFLGYCENSPTQAAREVAARRIEMSEDELLGDLYTSAVNLFSTRQDSLWQRVNMSILSNAILVLAIVTALTGSYPIRVVAIALSVLGLIQNFVWSVMTYQYRRFTIEYEQEVDRLEREIVKRIKVSGGFSGFLGGARKKVIAIDAILAVMFLLVYSLLLVASIYYWHDIPSVESGSYGTPVPPIEDQAVSAFAKG
jgi:hypothetical protein